MANWFADFFDPLGLFHRTSSQERTDDQWRKSYELQERALKDQESAFEYQKLYDKWAQDFAQSQDQFSRQSYLRNQAFNENSFRENMDFQKNTFAQQMQLAQSPVSTVVQDASKVGINPMAALGMSAGSASAGSASASSASYGANGAPSSNAHEGFGASSLAPINNMPSLISALGSVGSAHIGAAQDERDSKRSAALRQQELDIIKQKNQNDFSLANRSLDIEQQNADSNTSQAQTARGNLNARQAEFAFEKIKTIKEFNLKKDMNKFTKKMSEQQFYQNVYNFNKEVSLKKQELSQQLKKIENDKDFQSGYLRMQYITKFGSEVMGLLKAKFGVSNLNQVMPNSGIVTNPGVNDSLLLGQFRDLIGIK